MSSFEKRLNKTRGQVPKRGLWTHADEDLLRSGEWRYATLPHWPVHGSWDSDTCTPCAIAISAERRRMTVEAFMTTVEPRYGGSRDANQWPHREPDPKGAR